MQLSDQPTTAAPEIALVPTEEGAGRPSIEDRLVRARLGPYAGLYYALKAKHPPAAAHCLRVAIGCSKWAAFSGLPEPLRDLFEISGLLHDIGKIGAPDCILQKPEALNAEEQQSMDLTVSIGTEILAGIGSSEPLIETIQQARLSFDSGLAKNPLARMLKIVDAFDSMTTVQVFRPAISRERAIDELFSYSGTQFDPEMVRSFTELVSQPRPELEKQIGQHWLSKLSSGFNAHFAGFAPTKGCAATESVVNTVFHYRLLDSLPDAAIYVDKHGRILVWNRAAEQLSGRSADSVLHRQWAPKLLGLHSEEGAPIDQDSCPLQRALLTNTRLEANFLVVRKRGKKTSVGLTAIPLFFDSGGFAGFVLLIRDASLQSALEQKVRSLHVIATQDQLTKVANRAELDRRLQEFVIEHSTTGSPGSIIMCDIDYFKRINDQLSHQAGDQALITFANILRGAVRKEDLVARYGGEEFVILCEGCDINAAHAQAEKIRRLVESTPVPALKGKALTSSFGVTELQQGDDAETFLARADRALLRAKESGRNRVIQLGAGQFQTENRLPGEQSSLLQRQEAQRSSWLSWFTGQRQPVLGGEYLSSVPIGIAVQKLQGFIRDHKAEILSTTANELSIRIRGIDSARRRGEHPVPMIMKIYIEEVQYCTQSRTKVYQNRTKMSVQLYPVKTRDRRRDSLEGQAHQLLLSFQAYIVGQVIDDELRLCIIEPR
jgi:diguanylate cyclase (GGDEF)-like protein/PAS domain S-box-containing protein